MLTSLDDKQRVEHKQYVFAVVTTVVLSLEHYSSNSLVFPAGGRRGISYSGVKEDRE